MICSNCGHENAPGNRFCGSCGLALNPDGSSTQAGAGEQPAGGEQPSGGVSDETQVVETVAPPPVPPAVPQAATSAAHGQPPADTGPMVDDSVFCWNCGARNSLSRRFCHRCGEQLTAGAAGGAGAMGAAAAVGGGGRGYPPDGYYDDYYDDRGGRGRPIAIAVALLAIVLLAGGAMIILLGGGLGPGPAPSPTDAGAISPSPDASPTDELSPSPEPSPSPAALPSPTDEVPAPTAEPTPDPATPTPTATPTQPATPTPAPTPANCDGFSSPSTSTSLTNENPTRQISSTRVWCVSAIVFGSGEGDGTLKIFLTNPVFLTDEYGYSSATIGWTEVLMENGLFNGSDSVSPPMDLIHPVLDQTRSIRMFPQGTEIQLQIMCSGGPDDCSGSVRIDHVRRPAPPLP